MAKRTQTAENPATWLPPELRGERGKEGPAENGDATNGDQGAELDQWLAIPEAASNGRKRTAEIRRREAPSNVQPADHGELAGSSDGSAPRPLRARRDRGRTPRERWIASRLRRAKEKLRAREAVIEELTARVADLEAAVERSAKQPTPKPAPANGAIDEKVKPANGRGPLDLNTATFEQLRVAGFSLTQSARLIAYRDARDGFDSVEELAEVPGFSPDVLGDLRSQFQLSGR
jgi:DNA uptake protein ComE-like DNA-binding protein